MKNSCKIDQCYRLDENSSRLDLILHTDNSSTLDQMKSLDLIRPVFSKTGRTDRFIKELYKKNITNRRVQARTDQDTTVIDEPVKDITDFD